MSPKDNLAYTTAVAGFIEFALTCVKQNELFPWAQGIGTALANQIAVGEPLDTQVVREFVYRIQGRLTFEQAQEADKFLQIIQTGA